MSSNSVKSAADEIAGLAARVPGPVVVQALYYVLRILKQGAWLHMGQGKDQYEDDHNSGPGPEARVLSDAVVEIVERHAGRSVTSLSPEMVAEYVRMLAGLATDMAMVGKKIDEARGASLLAGLRGGGRAGD